MSIPLETRRTINRTFDTHAISTIHEEIKFDKFFTDAENVLRASSKMSKFTEFDLRERKFHRFLRELQKLL